MQETRVWSLIWEDPTFLRATGPMYNYWACALKPRSLNYGSLSPRVHALQQEKPLQWEAYTLKLKRSPHSPQLEKARAKQWKRSTAKIRKASKIWALGATVISLFLGPLGKQNLETPPYTHMFLYYKTWVHTNATIVQLHRTNSRLLTAHIWNSLSSKVRSLTAHLPDTYLLPALCLALQLHAWVGQFLGSKLKKRKRK